MGSAAVAFGKERAPRFGVRGPLPKAGLRERAELLRRLGYDGMELGPEWLGRSAESILGELAGTGIAVSAIVGSLGLLDVDAAKRSAAVELDRRRLEMAKALGAGFVIEVPVFGENRFPDLSPLMTAREVEERLLVAGLRQLAGDVKRAGVTMLLEPLTKKETHFMTRQREGVATIEAVGAAGFMLLSDFYHMQMEEADVGECLARDGKYTGYVHLADGERRTEPGSLPFDYRPGFRALKKWGYGSWLTVESGATSGIEESLGRALEYLKKQWAEA